MAEDIPTFHDGKLVGINLLDDEIRLSVNRYNGERWEVMLSGVLALQMDDFLKGNIISALEVFRDAEPDRQLLQRLYPGPHRSADPFYLNAHNRFIEEQARLVLNGSAALISIIPSYGADLVALVRAISVTKVDVGSPK